MNTTTSMPTSKNGLDTQPWWRHGHLWLVIAGPAVVVVAAFITLWLAITRPDPVVDENYYEDGLNINQEMASEKAKGLLPAEKGRNHAATPAQDIPLTKH